MEKKIKATTLWPILPPHAIKVVFLANSLSQI